MDGKPTLFIDETRYDPQWILRIPALIPGKGNIVEPGADDADDDTDDETVDQILFLTDFCDQKPIYICEGDAADDADRIPIDVSSKNCEGHAIDDFDFIPGNIDSFPLRSGKECQESDDEETDFLSFSSFFPPLIFLNICHDTSALSRSWREPARTRRCRRPQGFEGCDFKRVTTMKIKPRC